MREYMGKGGESPSHEPRDKGIVPTLAYANDDGTIDSTIRAPEQHVHVHTTIGQFGGVPRFGYRTYPRDSPQKQPVYVDRQPVARHQARCPKFPWEDGPVSVLGLAYHL